MTPTELSRAADISVPYASQIINGERKPSLKLAIKIYDETGQLFGPLVGLGKEQINGVRVLAA